jgi:hypothetical protein
MKAIILALLLSTSFFANATSNGANNNCNGRDSCRSSIPSSQSSAAAAALSSSSVISTTSSLSNSTSTSNSNQTQAQTQNSSATGGTSSNANNINLEGDKASKMPASSAISPSVGTWDECQIATPSSKALSVLLISISGTTGVTYNDLCYAYKRKQFDVADKLMCEYSATYKKVNPSVCN